jgi:hypothetical protein
MELYVYRNDGKTRGRNIPFFFQAIVSYQFLLFTFFFQFFFHPIHPACFVDVKKGPALHK